ncbi:MAG: hypothetical protein ACFFC3_00245 [Candidatus Odinarchaeota archaeon]
MIFEEIQFPLIGPMAEIALIVEWVIVLLYLELGLLFLNRVFKFKNKLKSLQERGYVYLFLGFSLMWIFFIIGDHYVHSSEIRTIFSNCGYVSLMIVIVMFMYTIESYRILLKRYLFTIIFSSNFIFYFIIIIYDLKYGQIISYTFWPIFIVFLIFYNLELNSIFKSNPILGKFRFKFLQYLIGGTTLIFGFALTTDLIINLFGLISRIIGDFLQIFTIFFLYSYFSSTPSFLEYNWQKEIEGLLIIHKSGLLIYEKSFTQETQNAYRSSISGVITMLRMMLEQISEEKDTSVIEKKGKYIIIQPGDFIYGVIISKEKLNSLHVLLNSLIVKIESIYYNLLEKWDGDLTVFRPIDKIVQDYFG